MTPSMKEECTCIAITTLYSTTLFFPNLLEIMPSIFLSLKISCASRPHPVNARRNQNRLNGIAPFKKEAIPNFLSKIPAPAYRFAGATC